LPINKKTVIVFVNEQVAPGFYHPDKKYWMIWSGWANLELNNFTPTHWMPLPEPPEKK